MTVVHHPSDGTLAAFAAGGLDEGRLLVVATHLLTCPACRKAVGTFESVGGTMLDDIQPAAMTPGALQRALADIASEQPQRKPGRVAAASDVPGTLASYGLGSWRWIGPGIYRRDVRAKGAGGTRVFMLKASPGTALPHHKHTGTEWTCIIQGAFRHEGGRYAEGDFDEADEDIEHTPVIEDGAECICLVALQGEIRLQGWIGRMLQPFVRI